MTIKVAELVLVAKLGGEESSVTGLVNHVNLVNPVEKGTSRTTAPSLPPTVCRPTLPSPKSSPISCTAIRKW